MAIKMRSAKRRSSRKSKPNNWIHNQSKRKNKPASWFLDSKHKKYPYKVNGKISCERLRNAIRLAGMHGDASIKARAQRLYARHCRKSK